MALVLNGSVFTTTDAVTTANTDSFSVIGAKTVAAQCVITDETPVEQDFLEANVNTTSNAIVIADHGFSSGLKVQLTTGGVLPAGLSVATDYFVLVIDEDTIKLCDSLVDVGTATAIDVSDNGTDGGTITPVSIQAANVRWQVSIDGTNWNDIEDSEVSITGDMSIYLEVKDPTAKFMRVQYTLTGGQLSAETNILVK